MALIKSTPAEIVSLFTVGAPYFRYNNKLHCPRGGAACFCLRVLRAHDGL